MTAKKKRPVGRLYGMVERPVGDPIWAPMGTAWLSDSGNLMLNVDSVPVSWFKQSYGEQLRVLVKLEEGVRVVRPGPRVGWEFSGSGTSPSEETGGTGRLDEEDDDIPFG